MNKLPHEALIMIAQSTFEPWDFKFRISLLLASRRWRSVLLPTFYSQVRLDGPQIMSLVVALKENPSNESCINILTLWSYNPRFKAATHNVSKFRSWIKDISHSQAEVAEWEDELEKGNNDAWFALLLTLKCIAIFHSKFGGKFVRCIVSRAALREGPFESMPILHQLGFLKIVANYRTTYQAKEFLPLFLLQSLKSADLDGVIESHSPNDSAIPGVRFVPRTLSTVFLCLCGNGRYGMMDLISSCRNRTLEHFEWQHTSTGLREILQTVSAENIPHFTFHAKA
ncbi:uncharacterized protein BO97DRAFT_183976 [Aspergillus homomorphus CBS 101889]|uniref:F-box domain-containing protein n=1 Tax=Aspergillus homomorphus (strain CBS 101889) TaxID=1450537 RepID=A0A395IAN1_ASPHC|nr:hypothetical protein BO97DRAFT_183976 [Aspergillus homomorphus CBS 101889]RAL16138.1 hypothetical protein BO97DRAFT_183976 [Aspergillus homomorphus CBS 101889]